MTRKSLTAVLSIAALAVTALVGCSSAGESTPEAQGDDEVLMGISFCYLTNAGMQAEKMGDLKAAEDAGWKTLEPTDANSDEATQFTQVQNLISQGIDVLALHACSRDGAVAAVEMANEAGVIVYAPDQDVSGGDIAVHVGLNQTQAGDAACQEMINRIGTEGKVVEMQGDMGSAAGQGRTSGFHDCIEANAPGIEILTVATKWDAAEGTAGLQPLLAAHSDIDGIYMQSDSVFYTAVEETLRQANRLFPVGEAGHIVLGTVDGSKDVIDGIKAGFADFAVYQPLDQFGPASVPFVQKALDGTLDEIVPPTESTFPGTEGLEITDSPSGLMIEIPTELITPENVDSGDWWALKAELN